MGLDTTHNCFHGAYSAFNRWRHKLAEVAGYQFVVPNRNTFDGFQITNDSGNGKPLPLIDWGHLAPEEDSPTLNGDWEETPSDPLLVLIVHYDCEGFIRPAQASPLADRLEDLLPELEDIDGHGHLSAGYHQITQWFIKGLREAAAKNESVEFL